jgi:hypothetical protein
MVPIAAAIVLSTMLVATTPAQAFDAFPCRDPYRHRNGSLVQVCPLWKGHVPVYQVARGDSPIVGYLEVGGYANWFFHQTPAADYWYGNYHNKWWARTITDGTPNAGFVPEVFFQGGGNDEPDANLMCIASAYGNCDGLRPWQG